MLKRNIYHWGLILLTSVSAIADSGTGVGNGGDPVFSFLSSTRFAYSEVLKDIGLDSSVSTELCQANTQLNAEQKALCREFLLETYTQLLALNGTQVRTEFVLRQAPLLVEGPDGVMMPVAARTPLGADGVIEFHRPSILYYPPRQMLFLIAHEFGHKANFRGHPLTDNERIGPFATGRELLDAAAEAIVSAAEARGRIGKSFGLQDYWQCQVVFSSGQIAGVTAATMRLFYMNSLDRYEAGVSRRPDDSSVFTWEDLNSRLLFKIRVTERLGCLNQALHPEDRGTRLEIVRVREQSATNIEPAEEIVTSMDLPLVNPICEEKPRWLELFTNGVGFRCRYSGSQGGFQ